MCHFISWITFKDQVFFLDNSVFDQPVGAKLLGEDYCADLSGHGAILHYYPELKNKNYYQDECEDFSNPDRFPDEIVKAIKKGEISIIGLPEDVLTVQARKSFHKACRKNDDHFCNKSSEAYEYRDLVMDYGRKCNLKTSDFSSIERVMDMLDNAIDLEKNLEEARIFSKIIKKKKNRVKAWK